MDFALPPPSCAVLLCCLSSSVACLDLSSVPTVLPPDVNAPTAIDPRSLFPQADTAPIEASIGAQCTSAVFRVGKIVDTDEETLFYRWFLVFKQNDTTLRETLDENQLFPSSINPDGAAYVGPSLTIDENLLQQKFPGGFDFLVGKTHLLEFRVADRRYDFGSDLDLPTDANEALATWLISLRNDSCEGALP